MSENEKKSGFKWLDRLKKIKHIEVYIAIIFVVILLLIYMSNFAGNGSGDDATTTNELSITTYVDNLETNLENILSNIGGVSNVKVMITLDMNQATVSNSQIVLDDFPAIKGVIVTAKGVNDTSIRLKVLHAVEAVLDITNGSIEILSSD